jgi:hypothetical protein
MSTLACMRLRHHHLCHSKARALSLLTFLALAAAAAPGAVLAAAPSPPGDIPDTQAFVTFTGSGFSIKVPDGWSHSTKGGTTAFVDKYNGIAVMLAKRASAPTVSSTKGSELAKLKAATKGFANPTVATVSRPAGSGVLVRYQASSAPNSVTGKTIANDVERYELWRAGKLAIVTLQAPHGSDNVDAWKLVTSSLRWTK